MKEQTVWVLMVLIVFLGLVLSTPVFSACSSDEYGNCTGSCSCAAGQLGGCHCDPEHSCREVNTCYYPATKTPVPTKEPSDTPQPTSQGACNRCDEDPNPCGKQGTYTSCTDTYQSGTCGYICTYKNSPTPNPTTSPQCHWGSWGGCEEAFHKLCSLRKSNTCSSTCAGVSESVVRVRFAFSRA